MITNELNMKRVVIVGASSGIGYGLAEALASRGVPVGLAARHTESLHELQKKYPDKVEYLSLDVTKPSAVEKLDELIEKLGGMDIYIHAAGIASLDAALDPETEVKTVRTNAEGFARMLSAAYRYYHSRRKPGQIAAISSVAGTKGLGRLTAYSASKAFDQAYMVALEQLANAEHADIAFTDIRPGWVRTPLVGDDGKFPMEMTVEHVIPKILEAIVHKRRVAVIDWRWNVAVGLIRLVPNCLWTLMDIPLQMPHLCLCPGQADKTVDEAIDETEAALTE